MLSNWWEKIIRIQLLCESLTDSSSSLSPSANPKAFLAFREDSGLTCTAGYYPACPSPCGGGYPVNIIHQRPSSQNPSNGYYLVKFIEGYYPMYIAQCKLLDGYYANIGLQTLHAKDCKGLSDGWYPMSP